MIAKSNRVLIVDDEFSIREALNMALKDTYEITTASNAVEGLSIISSRQDFDVVIMDIRMPNMDGISALKTIKETHPDAEVIIITAYASIQTAQEALQYGALDYVLKPFDCNVIKNIINKGIAKRGEAVEKKQKQATLEKAFSQANKDLKITGQLLKTLYQYANDGIIITDRTGKIINANEQVSAIYSYDEEQVLGKHVESLEPGVDKAVLEERMQRLLSGEALVYESEYCRGDGAKINLEISSKAISVDDEVYIQSIHRDITEKKRLQSQLLHSQKMESIGRLAGGIAHDFNNIVSAISGFAQLILEYERELSPDIVSLVRMIESSSKMGNSMISKLLSFARRGKLEITSLKINAVIEETIDMIGRLMRNIEIIKDLHQSIPRVNADRSKMDQVIMNLLVNARDAMPNGGRITVKTSLVRLNSNIIKVPASIKEGEYICLSVEDTGTGIPRENLTRIFDPFFTTKEEGKGTGLGLATVWGIVKEHSGYITVDSTVGKGTTFTIYLPLSPVKIVVLDDEIPVLRLIKDILNKNGYDATVFNDSEQFRSYYRENNDKLAVAIIDTIMPSVETGSLIRELQSVNPHINIIALTGLDALEFGNAVSVLKKPVDVSLLLSLLQEIC